jgi:hypothetical protein
MYSYYSMTANALVEASNVSFEEFLTLYLIGIFVDGFGFDMSRIQNDTLRNRWRNTSIDFRRCVDGPTTTCTCNAQPSHRFSMQRLFKHGITTDLTDNHMDITNSIIDNDPTFGFVRDMPLLGLWWLPVCTIALAAFAGCRQVLQARIWAYPFGMLIYMIKVVHNSYMGI